MGHAMEYLLAPRQTLHVWQRRPPSGSANLAIETAARQAEFILFCVPATAHPGLAQRIAPHLGNNSLCLTIAKGLDDASRTPAEVLTAAFGRARVAVLYGPMISEEIRAGKPAFAECGVYDDATFSRINDLFRETRLRLEASHDLTGLSWSAILKNVYAMAIGMADELALGDNVRGFLTVAALEELSGLVRHLGAEAPTPYRLAGLGDLITTATSADSHHHDLGRRIARGERDQLSGEGIHTLAMLRATGRFRDANAPLFRLVDACVQQPEHAGQALRDFINRW